MRRWPGHRRRHHRHHRRQCCRGSGHPHRAARRPRLHAKPAAALATRARPKRQRHAPCARIRAPRRRSKGRSPRACRPRQLPPLRVAHSRQIHRRRPARARPRRFRWPNPNANRVSAPPARAFPAGWEAKATDGSAPPLGSRIRSIRTRWYRARGTARRQPGPRREKSESAGFAGFGCPSEIERRARVSTWSSNKHDWCPLSEGETARTFRGQRMHATWLMFAGTHTVAQSTRSPTHPNGRHRSWGCCMHGFCADSAL